MLHSNLTRGAKIIAKLIIFYGFQKLHEALFGRTFLRFRPSLPWGFAAGSGSILACFWNRRSSRSRSSSSRRKQPGEEHLLKSSFSIGFRSYMRHFWGALLMRFRPSLPWGFAAGSASILGYLLKHRRSSRSRSRSSSSSRKQRLRQQAKNVAKIKSSFSMGFRSYMKHFLGCTFDAFPSFTAMGIKYIYILCVGSVSEI